MRARNIKPGFFKNAELAECSIPARLLAPGLWMLADREGRLEDRPKQIKGELFPYDSIEVEPLLRELVKWGHIIRYEVDGHNYIQITEFAKHQRPHPNEIHSKIPKAESTSNQGVKDLALIPDTLIPDIRNADSAEVKPPPKVTFTGNRFEVPEETRALWAIAYPAIPLDRELAGAAAWLAANPKNRKSNFDRFLTNWLSRAQDKAPRVTTTNIDPIYKGVLT